ncbi:hypothetical protein RUND412_003034 [Rhizina undulata]
MLRQEQSDDVRSHRIAATGSAQKSSPKQSQLDWHSFLSACEALVLLARRKYAENMSLNKVVQQLEVRGLPSLSTTPPHSGEEHEAADVECGDGFEKETDSDETDTDCSENGCGGNDEDEQDENDATESDTDKETIEGEEEKVGDIPNWARWIWRMMVLYWIAVVDGEDDHAFDLQDQFRMYGKKKGIDYKFFLLRTQTVKFQLTTLKARKDLTVNLETGALSKPEVEDKCILELLGEHIELRNREDVRRRAGLVEWKLIENDWEAICENRGITAKSQGDNSNFYSR